MSGSLTAAIRRRKIAWVQREIAAAGCRLLSTVVAFSGSDRGSRESLIAATRSHAGDRRWIGSSALIGDEP